MIFSKTSKKIGVGLLTWGALALLLLFSASVRAQVTGATLSGTVTDSSGAIVPQAQISIKNVATGVNTTVKSDAAGFYSAPNLLPGNYDVSASAPGFSTEVQSGVTLTVGAQQVLNFALRVGEVTQTLQVSGEAPVVDLASSAISAVVSSSTVVELPLNGRSWTDLTTLQPGVTALTTQWASTATVDRGLRGFGAEVTISGARPQQNNYRLDGVSMNDYGNGGPGNVLGGNTGVDAIQEFSVLTTNYSAEYGKTAGGVINAITRSGTNQFHGSAYEFLRNSALDARNFFDVGGVPPFKRNQFGGSVGGPIQKDRTFFFADYEAVRQAKDVSVLDIVPSLAARAGNLCSNPGTSACTPTTVTVDPSAQKYLPLYPLPNGGLVPGGNGDSAFFTFAGTQAVKENFVTSRVDHKFSGKDSLAGSFMLDKTPFTAPDAMNDVLKSSLTLMQLYSIEETHIFSPNLVNTVRAGFNRVSADVFVSLSAINPVAGDPSLSAQPGRDAASVIIGGGFTQFPAGLNASSQNTIRWNSFQGYDDAFLTQGTHSLKFGVAVERMQMNRLSGSFPGGIFTFTTLGNFLTNTPKQFQSGIASTITPRGYRQTLVGAYVQDDWRWRPNVTLNLGVRYEMVTVPTEVQNKLSNLINLTDSTPRLGSPLFNNPTLRNFEPRVGFAWDPFKNGKTAVRGGFGLFDSLPLPYEIVTDSASTPFFLKGTIKPPLLTPGSFFAGAAPLLAASGKQQVAYYEQNPKRSYVMQWNLNVQREIAPSVTAFIGYVGSHGVHLPFVVDDMDMVLPMNTSAGVLWPSGNGTKLNPNFGAINGVFWKGYSSYNALQTAVTKRMNHGVQLQGSFTWGKSIDSNSATQQGDQFTNGITSLDWFNPSLTRGLSDYNIPRTLVINATWLVPSPKSLSGAAAWALSGWTFGGIFKASDGEPWTPTFGTGGDPMGIGNSDDYAFPNRLTGPGCSSLVNPGKPDNYIKTQCFALPTAPSQAFYNANCNSSVGDPTLLQCFNLRGNAGRNIIPGPGLLNLDFSVFKDSYIRRISENFKVQFRAEFFNILNRADFGIPNESSGQADVFDANGVPIASVGKLITTTTDSREIQFALKVIW